MKRIKINLIFKNKLKYEIISDSSSAAFWRVFSTKYSQCSSSKVAPVGTGVNAMFCKALGWTFERGKCRGAKTPRQGAEVSLDRTDHHTADVQGRPSNPTGFWDMNFEMIVIKRLLLWLLRRFIALLLGSSHLKTHWLWNSFGACDHQVGCRSWNRHQLRPLGGALRSLLRLRAKCSKAPRDAGPEGREGCGSTWATPHRPPNIVPTVDGRNRAPSFTCFWHAALQPPDPQFNVGRFFRWSDAGFCPFNLFFARCLSSP